jgi:hypothetical protein
LVHDTLSKIYNSGIIKKKEKPNSIENENEIASSSENKKEINQYYDLGNHLRFSIGHGYPEVITKSSKELCHNADINKLYLSDPKNFTSTYRRKFFT